MVLNKQQQELAKKNHNLIYWYAKVHRLNPDDYYGDLAIELCRAAYNYSEEAGGSFTTYATKYMDNRIKQILEKKGRTIEGTGNTLSLNDTYYVDSANLVTLGDSIEDNTVNIENEVLFKIELDSFLKTLTDRERYIFKSIINQKSHALIGEELGISRQRVSNIAKKVRNKWYKRGEK